MVLQQNPHAVPHGGPHTIQHRVLFGVSTLRLALYLVWGAFYSSWAGHIPVGWGWVVLLTVLQAAWWLVGAVKAAALTVLGPLWLLVCWVWDLAV